jgi:hypothetical protein
MEFRGSAEAIAYSSNSPTLGADLFEVCSRTEPLIVVDSPQLISLTLLNFPRKVSVKS